MRQDTLVLETLVLTFEGTVVRPSFSHRAPIPPFQHSVKSFLEMEGSV